jgi:hypothetical protein
MAGRKAAQKDHLCEEQDDQSGGIKLQQRSAISVILVN